MQNPRSVEIAVIGENLIVAPIFVAAGESIMWRAPAGERLVLLFPEPDIFNEKVGRVEVGEEVVLTLRADAPKDEYPYAVYRPGWRSIEWTRGARLSGHSAFGIGGSHPRIYIV